MNGHFQLGDLKPTKYFFSIAVVLGLLFAMISNESGKPIPLVFLQWQLQTLVPMALLIVSHVLLLKIHRFRVLSPWLALLLSGTIAASLFSPLALAIDFYLEPSSLDQHFGEKLFQEWSSITPPIAICWLALNVPWVLGYRFEKVETDNNQTSDAIKSATPEPEFMRLLPPEKRGTLLFLKSELHYLLVVTDQGNSLILYNLGDAILQLPAELGLSVHRSYWVAFKAIEKLSQQGRQGKLILLNGQSVPVSRNKLKAVRETLQTL